jgi:hypothetical protein
LSRRVAAVYAQFRYFGVVLSNHPREEAATMFGHFPGGCAADARHAAAFAALTAAHRCRVAAATGAFVNLGIG